MLARIHLRNRLRRLPVPQMCRLDADAAHERGKAPAGGRSHELDHLLGKIAWGVECRSADVYIDHELLPRRAHGSVEPTPGLEPAAKADRRSHRRRVEEPVPPDHDAPAYDTAWMSGENNVHSGDDGCEVVVSGSRVSL